MTGLSTYVATKTSIVGVDWSNFASGILRGAGGAFGSGGGGDTAAVAEKARLEEAKKAAEKSAATWKWVGISAAAVIGVMLIRHKQAA